ncbi:MAG: hypothetical protein ABIW32_00395 [Terrimesophilobacter sp.]
MNTNNVTPEENVPQESEAVETPKVGEEATAVMVAEPGGDPALDATSEASPAAAPVQTVYVTAPTPPKLKGNRGVATLLAFLATIVFAVVYAGVIIIMIVAISPAAVAAVGVSGFFTNSLFFVPVLVFLVSMVLWALLANRAGWWSWVIGSLVIAALTYFASIGVLLLLIGGFGLTASAASAAFVALATNPAMIAAALVARESAIWFGAAISRRGRKVRERNYATWQAFEHDEAQKRAEFGGAAAA